MREGRASDGLGKKYKYRANSSSCASNQPTLPAIKGRIQQGCRHEMPIKSSVKGSLIKAGKQEDLTELMMDRISKGERLS